tara:strand:+ start:675 stop:815 length:141 start_codon:yes stop_codon:yes gene_type:complete
MPDMATHSIAPELNAPIEPERLEKPPDETVVKQWSTLSTKGMPAEK